MGDGVKETVHRPEPGGTAREMLGQHGGPDPGNALAPEPRQQHDQAHGAAEEHHHLIGQGSGHQFYQRAHAGKQQGGDDHVDSAAAQIVRWHGTTA